MVNLWAPDDLCKEWIDVHISNHTEKEQIFEAKLTDFNP